MTGETVAMTLAEWLVAQIAEDEARVSGFHQGDDPDFYWGPARVLAECAAKRRIVERFRWAADDPDLYRSDMELMEQWQDALDTLMDVAQPYADRAGWREEWGL